MSGNRKKIFLGLFDEKLGQKGGKKWVQIFFGSKKVNKNIFSLKMSGNRKKIFWAPKMGKKRPKFCQKIVFGVLKTHNSVFFRQKMQNKQK